MAVDDPECTVGLHFSKESVKALKELLNPENVLHAGCRVKKHPDACQLCVANNDCRRLPMHIHCRCTREFYLDPRGAD